MRKDLINAANKLLNVQNQENIWEGQPFESFHYLSADYSGKAGEIAFYEFLNRTKNDGLHDWKVIYDGDCNINPEDGTYDIVIIIGGRNTLGIKTARIGKQKSFQHDHLHNGECDCELLIDITPSVAYLTVICFESYSLNERHTIFGIKPHLRKNTNNNYKLDLRENHLSKGIENKITIRLDNTTTDKCIVDFLKRFLD
jgi:hypothetical protein